MTLTFKSPAIEVAAATMAELVEFVNAHSGKPPIKKFESRAKGVERVNAMIASQTSVSAPTGKSANASIAKAEAADRRARKEAAAEKPKAPTSAAEQMARVLTATAHPSTAKSAPVKKGAAKPTAEKTAKKATTGGRAHFTEDAVITIVHKGENPKRGTAADRYDLYRNGMTVAAYIAAGGQRRDVVWDQKMGWIKTAEPK